MIKRTFSLVAILPTLYLLGLLPSCEPHEHVATTSALPYSALVGTWQYDSAGAAFYDRQGHFSHRFLDPLLPGAWLTIGPARWTYSGSVREAHTYSRHGDTVWVRRVVDSLLLRAGYARVGNVGQVIGRTDTLLLTTLTRHRLILRDSTRDPDGSLTRVWRYYYSR